MTQDGQRRARKPMLLVNLAWMSALGLLLVLAHMLRYAPLCRWTEFQLQVAYRYRVMARNR